VAKQLSKEQINVNADLAAIGGKAFTELEYRQDENAKKLEAMKNEKLSNTDKLALQDAIKFKTEENDNSGDSTTSNN
jgi:hypothetical protein